MNLWHLKERAAILVSPNHHPTEHSVRTYIVLPSNIIVELLLLKKRNHKPPPFKTPNQKPHEKERLDLT